MLGSVLIRARIAHPGGGRLERSCSSSFLLSAPLPPPVEDPPPLLAGGDPELLAEGPGEMTLAAEAEVVRQRGQRRVPLGELLQGLAQPELSEVLVDRYPRLLLEHPAQVIGGDVEGARHVLQPQGLAESPVQQLLRIVGVSA